MRYFICFSFLLLPYLLLTQTNKEQLADAIEESTQYSKERKDEAAFSTLKQVLEKLLPDLEKDSLLGLAYHKMGAYAYNLGEKKDAITYYEQAVQIRKQVLPAHHFDVLKSQKNLGTTLYELEAFDAAEQQYARIIEQIRFNPSLSDDFKTDIYLLQGGVLARKRDFDLAENYIQTGIDLAEAYDDFFLVSRAYNKAVVYYAALEDGNSIVRFAQKRLNLYDNLPLDDRYAEDTLSMADCHQNLALGYKFTGDQEKAVWHYQRSIALNSVYESERPKYLGDAYNNLSDFYRAQGALDEALENMALAIPYYEASHLPQVLSIAYYNRGEIYFEQGKLEEALQDYQKAIQLYSYDFEADNYLVNPSRDVILRGVKPQFVYYLADKARILRVFAEQKQDLSILKTALATYDLVAHFIDDIRIEFESDESKAFLSKEAKGIYEQALSTCLNLYEQTRNSTFYEKAFQYAERSKALILLEAVKESNTKTLLGVDSKTLEREKLLRSDIKAIEQALFEADEVAQSNLRQELIEKEQQLAKLIEQIEKSNSTYYQMKYKVELPKIHEIQSRLEQEEGILEYFVGQKKIYWFYVSADQFTYDIIPLDFPLKKWIQDFREGIYKPFYKDFEHLDRDSLTSIYVEKAYLLYEKLLQGVIEKAQVQQKLRIIPDGVLGYIPFDALLTKVVEGIDFSSFGKAAFLHKNHQISYSYSIALLEEMSQLKIQPQRQMLAIAPSFEAKDTLMMGQTPIMLSAILGNQETSSKILHLFEGELLKDSLALKHRFIDLASQFRFLHIASHAMANEENANFSFISLSQLGDTLSTEQLLFVHELYLLELEAEMVVLSACEAGLGELKEGEGIVSLARAFSYAGAKSIITSLWQVSADKSMLLMEHFYQALEDGKSKDEALHAAKQHLIASGEAPHPYYWSGFIPIGEMSSVKGSGKEWMYYAGGVVFTLLFLIFLLKRKRQLG